MLGGPYYIKKLLWWGDGYFLIEWLSLEPRESISVDSEVSRWYAKSETKKKRKTIRPKETFLLS